MDNSRGVVEEVIYILLKDTPGSFSKSKKIFSSPFGCDREENCYVTRGEFLKKYSKKDEPKLISLVSIETPELSVAASIENVRPLKREEFEILHAVPLKMERFNLLQDPLFSEILMIKVNDDVTVHLDNKNLQEYKGKVRYIGPVQHKKGKHFGILFKRPVGDMDGTVDNITFFTAVKKHGAIVSADRIVNISKKNSTNELQKERITHIHNLDEYALLKKGSRVIFFDDKKIRRGTIRFLGYVTKRDNTIYAGVEVDKEMKGNKYGNLVEGRKVFDCGKNRGSIVEAVELIREEDFDNDQFEKLTNDVQNKPGTWSYEVERVKANALSGTVAAKRRDYDERGGVENRRELNQEEMKAQLFQEQLDLMKKAEEWSKRRFDSLPPQDTCSKNNQPMGNAADEYYNKERLRQIEEEKKAFDRSINSLSKGCIEKENLTNDVQDETSDPKIHADKRNGSKQANISVVAEEFFSCMICLDPAVDAVESLCCHKVFCDQCAKYCLDQPCPNCRTNSFDVTPSFSVRQFLGNLEINCSNDSCNMKTIRSNLADHLSICEFSVVKCKNNGCPVGIVRKDLNEHFSHCQYAIVECPNDGCTSKMKKREVAVHKQVTCEYENIQCSNDGCNARLIRRSFQDHQQRSCRYMIKSCPDVNCNFTGPGIKLHEHIGNLHYEIFIENFEELFKHGSGASGSDDDIHDDVMYDEED